MSTRSILKQLLDFFFLKMHFMYSFSIVVIENLYIQTSLMVALSLFRVKEGGGLFINQRWTLLVACFGASRCTRVVCRVNLVQNVQIDVCFSQLPWSENSHVWNLLEPTSGRTRIQKRSADMVRICLTRNELEGLHELGRRKSKRCSSRQNL
jgi:hypothetical protein